MTVRSPSKDYSEIWAKEVTDSINRQVKEFADNAAALAGKLKIGDTYRTGDVLKVVHS